VPIVLVDKNREGGGELNWGKADPMLGCFLTHKLKFGKNKHHQRKWMPFRAPA
jgi:hypothetical protein